MTKRTPLDVSNPVTAHLLRVLQDADRELGDAADELERAQQAHDKQVRISRHRVFGLLTEWLLGERSPPMTIKREDA